MTNENELDKDLEKAVEQALETPLPAPVEDRPLWLHEKASLHKGLKANTFRLGKREKSVNLPKVDAEGQALKLPNGGDIMVKDYSDVKFWHNGKLISKAEHDELTNGVK